ncbi:MAG TPA: DUF748 domain-containing protein [Casimicrobiaceae bacterium]
MNIRWKRWLVGAVGLLAAYTVAGFWLLPLVIKNQVPKFGQTELARQAAISEVRFNPYTLRLEAQDLRLAEADGAPLFAIGKLAVELQWRSLVRRAWSFDEIRIAEPSASLTIAADGKFNLAELLATLEHRLRKASTDTSLPRLIIGRFMLEQGKLDLRDHRVGHSDSFSPINFALTNFSTLPDQNDTYTFSADSAFGGKLRWKGEASVNPIRGSGELTLENGPLRELAVYLKSYTRATLAAGRLDATLPYRFAYGDGKLEASVAGAKLALRDLALAHEGGASDSFATLTRLDASGVSADLTRREVAVDELRAEGGKLMARRDAKGELDLANLLKTAAAPAAAPGLGQPIVINNWKLSVKQMIFDQVALSAVDETVSPPLKLSADKAQFRLQLAAEQVGADFKLTIADAAFSLADLALASGAQTPFKLARLGFTDGAVDLAARHASLGRLYAEGGQLQLTRDGKGQLNILGLLPKFGAGGEQATAAVAPAGAPWIAVAKSVELSKFGAEVEDQGTAVKVHVQDLAVKLEEAGSDLTRPVKFSAGLNLREGGQLSANGRVVPGSGALEADVRVKQLELAPLQPLLGKYVKLKIAGGSVSAHGRLTAGAGRAKSTNLRYVGGLDIAGLALNEESGELFAAWKSVGADKLTASLAPNLLEIPELRVVEPDAKLIIENDRSFNAARLLVRPASAATVGASPPAPAQAADDSFPVRIQRLRFQNAKLDFSDLSLRPQFSAKIYELNGVVSGLSSKRDSRSQIELDGRVDEFGLVRIRGELNPFAPADNTDVNVVFKNVDMVPASPYSMKFAGYKIAEGKISVDLQYKVRNSQLEGANQFVIDKLTLGERVDSPDALKLPLELAIAILKDSEGRIELGLPVSGNVSDPQFSYGAVIWKAINTLLTRIVSAPFRALGSLFGGSGEKLEAIDFDPGSDRLLPPEREKLKQVAQVLSKRPQLKLSVPGQYSEAADGAALKARAVRVEIAKRAGIKLEAGEEPGPLDLRARAVRGALRDLYAERFGAAELDKQKKAAEGGAAVAASEPAAKDLNTEAAQEKLPVWQRVGLLIQGEPQVADASSFYHKLQERLDQNQPLAADALTRLGAQRASAVLAALKEAGVDPARALAAAPEKVNSDVDKPVSLKLALVAK